MWPMNAEVLLPAATTSEAMGASAEPDQMELDGRHVVTTTPTRKRTLYSTMDDGSKPTSSLLKRQNDSQAMFSPTSIIPNALPAVRLASSRQRSVDGRPVGTEIACLRANERERTIVEGGGESKSWRLPWDACTDHRLECASSGRRFQPIFVPKSSKRLMSSFGWYCMS